MAISPSNISGTLQTVMYGPHSFRNIITYNFEVNGTRVDVVRQGSMFTCCTKIGSKHNYTLISHTTARTCPIPEKIKQKIVMVETHPNSAWGYEQVSRKVTALAPPVQPAPQVTVEQMMHIINELNVQVTKLNADLAKLTIQLVQASVDKMQLKAELTITQSQVASLRSQVVSLQSQLNLSNGNVAALRNDLVSKNAQIEQLTSTINQLISLLLG